ncbi:MAG: gas vesicle protein K [Planctomycetota bacterium]
MPSAMPSAMPTLDVAEGLVGADEEGLAHALSSTSRTMETVDLNSENVGKGLAHLVLTVVRLLHELLERQAIRRMDAGSLTDEEVDRLGRTLQAQSEEIRAMAARFGLEESDLNLDLGPLGKAL